MANRNSGGRTRSRKRRPAVRVAGGDRTPTQTTGADAARGGRARPREGTGRSDPGVGAARATGERGVSDGHGDRPAAPWHPLPLSELLILVGGIGLLVGLLRGVEHNAPTVIAGLAAVLIGTVEVTLREHRSGYRSHTLILAGLPAIVFHSAVILTVAAFTRVPHALNLGLLVIDAAIVGVLFNLLRARFRDAQRERRFARGR